MPILNTIERRTQSDAAAGGPADRLAQPDRDCRAVRHQPAEHFPTLGDVFADNELEALATVKEFLTVQAEGGHAAARSRFTRWTPHRNNSITARNSKTQ